MAKFLALQHTYSTVEIGLFDQNNMYTKKTIDHKRASALLIPTIEDVLKEHNEFLGDLEYIAVNQGPGPFTTLRVVIATVNGLSFSTQLPLVGIDGFDAFIYEHQQHSLLLILLNAFGGDVYYALRTADGSFIEKGCANVDRLLIDIAIRFKDQPITCVGNGVILYHQKLVDSLGSSLVIAPLVPEYCSLEAIAALSCQAWQHQQTVTYQVLPLYLKSAVIYQAVQPS